MKKVKTILASLMIILATAVISACSCSGSSNDDSGPQISVTSISIASDFSKATRDDETGWLSIKCSRNDEFDITYSLSPDNTTRTQVDWTFEGNDSVVVTKGNYYTYSNTASHTITFKATKVGKTVIKFKPKNTDKWTQATVEVGEAEAVWPSFVAPSGLDYNPTTGKVVWNAVSQMKTYTGEIQNVSTSNGIIGGLSGYILKYKNLTTGEEFSTPKDQPISSREYELPRGYTYEVSVCARGDDFSVKDSPMSETIRIHQLATVTNLANNNGTISFSTPAYSELNEVYYSPNDSKKCITRTSDGVSDISFNCVERDRNGVALFDTNLEQYNISVVSYPKGWASAKTEGKNYVYDNALQARLYPSIASDTLVVKNLPSPTITFGHEQGLVTIGDSTFGKEASSTNPYTNSKISWNTSNTYEDKYGVTYYYTVTNNTSGNIWTAVSSGSGDSFDTSNITTPNTNKYMLTVWMKGNDDNTIESSKSTIIFYMPQTVSGRIQDSTTLITDEGTTYIQGVDLYFVDLDNNSNSFYYFAQANIDVAITDKFVSTNISQLEDLKPGRWDIYGRFVGFTFADAKTSYYSGVGKYSKINGDPVIVSPAVQNTDVSITNTGVLSFKRVEVKDKDGATQTIDKYFITISQGNTSFAYETMSNDVGNSKISVNLYDIIRDNVEEGMFEEFTAEGNTINFSIVSAGIDGSGVNSHSSNVFSLKRNTKVDVSTVKIRENGSGQKMLLFTSSCDTSYTIQIGEYQYTTDYCPAGAEVSINLETADVGNDKKLIDGINSTGITTISIWANGSSKTSGTGTSAFTDSLSITVNIKCTEAVTDVEIDENGLLKWNIGNNTDEQFFIITLTGKKSGAEATETFKVSAIREALQSAEGEEENAQTQTPMYYYNIFDKISEFDTENDIAITIAHKVVNKFTHQASEPYYIRQLASAQISKCENNSAPAIKFGAKANISYYFYVGNDYKLSTKQDSDGDITKALSSILDNNLSAGTYQIKIIASKENKTDNNNNESGSSANPFIINSKQSQIEIIVVNMGIAVRANGDYIEWSQLHPEATYTLQYKETSSDVWTTVTENDIDKVFDKDTLKFDVSSIFEGGKEYNVRVIPNINYMDNSVVLLGNIKEDNTITRMPALTLTTDGNGKLSYSKDVLSNIEYDIVVYAGNTILSKDEYTLNKTDGIIEILSSVYIGQKTYKIKVVADSYISSPLSAECVATKLSTVTNLSKEGDWLIFSTVEGADVYQITFVDNNGGSENKTIKLSGTTIQFAAVNEENGSDWTNAQESEAKYLDGKIWLNYKAQYLNFQTTEAGTYYYCVTAQTRTTGYLNGNMSAKYEIIKLSDKVDMTTSGESFILSNYQYSDDELETPISIEYTITYIENISKEYQKDDSWSDIVWYFDPAKFNTNDSIEYVLTFTKSVDGTIISEIIKLRLTPNGTSTPKLEMSTIVDDQETFVQKDYVTPYNNQYKITFPTSEIEKVKLGDSLEYADSITLSYIRQLDVCTQTVPFASAISEDGTFNYTINLNTLGIYDEGSYSLKVKFVGNDNNVLSSQIKESEQPVTKLTANALFTEEGVLSWSANSGATDYTIRITTDSNASDIAVVSDELPDEGDGEGDGDGEGEESNPIPNNEWYFEGYQYTGTNESTYNISEADLIGLNSQFTGFEVGKTYYVQIMANATGCLSSKWSDIFEVEKLKAPNNVTLTSTAQTDSQGNVVTTEIGSPMLTWEDSNNTANRLNYIYKIGDTENKVVNMTAEGMTWSGQLLPTDLISGNYDVAVKVVGNTTTGTNQKGLLTSDYSTQNPTLKYVDESSAVGFDSSTFSWNEVSGAYNYKLSFYRGSISTRQEFAEETPIYTTYTSKNNYEFTSSEFAGSGYFTVLVSAITDPTKSIVSTYVSDDENFESSKVLTNCASLYRANNVESLMVYDGLLAWTLDVNDMKEYLLSSNETKSKMIELFKGDKETISDEEIISNVYNFIKSQIDNKSSNNLDNPDKATILSHLLTFKANINGVDTVIIPAVVDAVKVEEDGTYSTTNIESAQYLMYKFSMNTEPGSEVSTQASASELENVINSTSKYTIKVAPQGNYAKTNSTVDGKYVGSITAYKPKTPRAVLIDDGENERKQISDGDLWWTLVTTEDSTLENMKFHETYTIQVVESNEAHNKVAGKTIDIKNTIVEDGETHQEVNTNLKDNSNYYRNLKALFEEEILANTNYQVQLNVAGTPDSTKLGENEKAYFNSNIFEYRDVLNILGNYEQFVKDGKYRYTPCSNMSTQTNVYVYGPFLDDDDEPIYAPNANDKSTWEWNNVKINNVIYNKSAKSYKEAIITWKKLIESIWNSAKQGGWTTLVNNYSFAEESSNEGDSIVSTARTTELNLTTLLDNNSARFGKGSYIIRKQEIGNGRGIISTDYSDNLIDYSTGEDPQPIELDYEQIATKLGQTSAVVTSGDTENDTEEWLDEGKFVWKNVERANAYKITIEKIALIGDSLSDTPSATATATVTATELVEQYYEMLEDMAFNDNNGTYQYRLVITATHLTEDAITDGYFEGDEVTTNAYYRTPVPTGLSISENGVVAWNNDFDNAQIKGFEVMVNQNNADPTTVETQSKSYDLSRVAPSVFDFSVRALGMTGSNNRYINSCYTAAIHIVKIKDPTIKVVKGNIEWGTETSDSVNNQITNTIFTLKKKQGSEFVTIEDLNKVELDAISGNYPLFSEITGYDDEYQLSGERFGATEYQYVIKYKGSNSKEVVGGETYVIASGERTENVTKLPSPELKYIDVITNNNSDNRVMWERIANASGYRALVITDDNKIFDIIQTFKDVVIDGQTQTQYSTKITIKNIEGGDKLLDDTNITDPYFYYDNTNGTNGSVQLSISEVINTMNLNAENGLSLKVYVQPIGTIDSTDATVDKNNLFISGSFSDVQTIEIPAAPKNAAFDEATGELTWAIGSEEDKGHNVRITMGYYVNDVSAEELENYWKFTSDNYVEGKLSTDVANASANRQSIGCASDIISRTIEITQNANGTYSIKVTDIVFLSAQNRKTPTSYRVTNTGDKYSFAIRVLVGADDNGTLYQGIYMSDTAELNSTASKSYSFHIFASGDGSTRLPYKVQTYTMFNAIRYYTNANFEIVQDISFKDVNNQIVSWNMIEKFTGTIKGNGHTISYITPNAMTATRKVSIDSNQIIGTRDEEMLYSALIVENAGTIQDLNITINNVYGDNPGARTVWASGFVISNTGTIENVHIQTFSDGKGRYIYIAPADNLYATMVAGLAIENSGTITGSSVESEKIYSLDNSNLSTYVAGLVCTNTGTISNSYFSGNITGNIVGGVVITNDGTINNSYAIGTAKITDISDGLVDNEPQVTNKGLGIGGIAYEICEGSIIDSCYSILEIEVDIRTSDANLAHIGGLVAMTKSNKATIKNCYVVYQAYNTGTIAQNQKAYAVAPNVTTYENNFYTVKTTTYEENGETKTRENIATENSNVATEKTLEELCSSVVAIKNENGETVYTMSIFTTNDQGDEVTKTYDHPVLISNPEK